VWVGNLSSASILIPMLLGLCFFKYLSEWQKYFFFYIVLSLLFESVSIILYYNKINNHWLFKLILLTDMFFFIWFYHKLGISANLLKVFSIAILGFSLVFFTVKDILNAHLLFDSLFYILIFLFFIIQSAIAIIHIFENTDLNPTSNFIFWIAFARLMYFLIIFVIYVYPTLQSVGYDKKLFWLVFNTINAIGNILGNILYGVSFLCRKTNN
jgi:hypothetical protein